MTKVELATSLERKNPQRYSYMVLMNLPKTDLQRTYDREFKVKILKDDRMYDSKGNIVNLESEPTDIDLVEPYDPAYLTDEKDEYDISRSEKAFLRKVSILEGKLRKTKIKYEWIERWSCFRVERYINSDYPTYRYLRINMDENDYSFGTEKEDLVFDTKVSVAVDAAVKWVNSNIIKK